MSREVVAALLILLPLASVAANCDFKSGKRAFDTKCGICHVAEAGVPHTVGPNLHGVVGRPIGQAAAFLYSEALAKAEAKWSQQLLNEFLIAPQKVFPGTAMPFQGLKSEVERQKLICFMETLK